MAQRSTYRQVQADPTSCISPAAGIIGQVVIGPRTCVFAGAQIRGDVGRKITIGARSNVQDCAVIHVAPEYDTTIGDGVVIGHSAIVHGCTLEDDVLIGMGAIVMDGALIRRNSVVGAGALVTGGKEFPENSLIIGSPARAVRTLSDEEVERLVRDNVREHLAISQTMVDEGMMFHPDETFDAQVGA